MFRNRFLTGILAGAVTGLALTLWLVPSRRNAAATAADTSRRLGGRARRVVGSVRQGMGDWLRKG